MTVVALSIFLGAVPVDSMELLSGGVMESQALAGKAVLFVNVASKCGYTPQYDGLQSLHKKYGSKGLVVVGVPCNQFGGQEPGTAKEIQTFCRVNYGVSFPLLKKQDVNGPDRSPLYKFLVTSPKGGGKDIGWNFEKFVVDRKGKVVARFPSSAKPESPELVAAIEGALK